MSKLNLDPKQWQHIKTEKGMTTLRHKDGHELNIAHNSLSPQFQKQLSSLGAIAKQAATPLQGDEMKHQNKLAEGGKVSDKDKAMKLQEQELEYIKHPEKRPESERGKPVNPHPRIEQRKTIKVAEGGEVSPNIEECSPEQMAEGGNVKEQKKKVFGTQSSPSKPEMREKHIDHLKTFVKKLFDLDLQPSGGKIDPNTGKRKNEKYVSPGESKPDWRSGKLEAQWNPDAIVHELAHLLLLPKGVGLHAGQKLMDQQYKDVQKNYGYMKQKRSQYEVQPMAVENIIRRHLGLPAATQSTPVKPGEGPRVSVEDPNVVIGTRIKKPSGKEVDLIRQSRFLSPENRELIERRLSGVEKFHPERGWLSNLEHMGNKIQALKQELPAEELMAEGGEVEDNSRRIQMDPDKAAAAQRGAQRSGWQGAQPMFHNIMKGLGIEPDPQYEAEHARDPRAEGGQIPQHYAEGTGDVEPFYDATDAGTPEQPPESMAAPEPAPKEPPESLSVPPRGDLPPALAVPEKQIPSAENPYKIAYDKQYEMDRYMGMDEEQAKTHAFQMAEMQQKMDEARLSKRVDEQQAAHTAALAENQRRQQLGMPMLDVPQATIPGAPGASQHGPVPPPQHAPDQGMQQPPTPFSPMSQLQHQQQDDAGMGEYGSMMRKGFQQAESGIMQHAKAAGELGQQQAALHEQRAEEEHNAQQQYTSSYNDLMTERQHMIDDIRQGYIDPEKFWDNHSKVATGIGMILAGFNPTTNPNAAMNFLKFQMEQNLNAQRENLGAKQNLLRANLQQFGELRAATEMTRIMQADVVAHQLEAAAGKAASPLAKAAALQAAGQLRMQVAPAFQQLALRQSIIRMASQGGSPQAIDQLLSQLRVFNPEMAKEIESRYIPGIPQLAKIPIPQPARDAITAYSNVDRLMNEAIALAQKPETGMSLEERARGETLMGELQSSIRTAEDQGVYKKSEAEFMNSMLGKNPAGFLAALRTEPKLKEMQRIKQNEHRALRRQYGLPPPQYAPQQSTQIVHVKGQPGTIQVINGKQYFVPQR